VWTSETRSTATGSYKFVLANGDLLSASKSVQSRVLCVRGGRAPAARVTILSAPYTGGDGTQAAAPIVAAVTDADGNQVNAEGITLTLASVPAGALTGALTAETDVAGRARLDDWVPAPTGALPQQVQLEVAAPGLSSASWTIAAGAERHTCRPGGSFTTGQGGCQHDPTGLVFSAPALDALTWHMGIWDASSPEGNVEPDEHDGLATNDYDPNSQYGTGSGLDSNLMNYCHELEEGGFLDWRMPTREELSFAQAAGAHQLFGFPTEAWFWSSTYSLHGPGSAYTVWLGEAPETDSLSKATYLSVLCVRRP
jgi:hypothetical protein